MWFGPRILRRQWQRTHGIDSQEELGAGTRQRRRVSRLRLSGLIATLHQTFQSRTAAVHVGNFGSKTWNGKLEQLHGPYTCSSLYRDCAAISSAAPPSQDTPRAPDSFFY